jgi:hypothetical protein
MGGGCGSWGDEGGIDGSCGPVQRRAVADGEETCRDEWT